MKPPRVLVVDDEPLAGGRRSRLLLEAGREAVGELREDLPRIQGHLRRWSRPKLPHSQAKTRRAKACNRGLGAP